jgi:hypothetical protein
VANAGSGCRLPCLAKRRTIGFYTGTFIQRSGTICQSLPFMNLSGAITRLDPLNHAAHQLKVLFAMMNASHASI